MEGFALVGIVIAIDSSWPGDFIHFVHFSDSDGFFVLTVFCRVNIDVNICLSNGFPDTIAAIRSAGLMGFAARFDASEPRG
jgi:hypothetical protein